MNFIFVVTIITFLSHAITAAPPAPSGNFNKISRWGNMIVYWKVDGDVLTIELQGNTTGWVGMYFSPGQFRRGMKNADITLGSVIDDEVYVKDLFSESTYNRKVDKRQDVKVVSGEEVDGWTSVQFNKTIVKSGCVNGNDDCQDTDLSKGPVNLCVALAGSDMATDASNYAYHSWRSTENCETVDFLKDTNKKEVTTIVKPTKKKVPKQTPVDDCQLKIDKYAYCPKWAELGYCEEYSIFMERSCKKSCCPSNV